MRRGPRPTTPPRRAALAAYLDLGEDRYREGQQALPLVPAPAPAPRAGRERPVPARAGAGAGSFYSPDCVPPPRPQLQFHHSPRHDALVLVASRF